jgi:hypothetical protein
MAVGSYQALSIREAAAPLLRNAGCDPIGCKPAESPITGRKELRAVVEYGGPNATRRHAPAHAASFVQHGDKNAALLQRTRRRQACNTRAYHQTALLYIAD